MAQEIADSTLLDTWGSGGNIVEPDVSKIIEGWQLGEQPPHEYMNWLQNTFGSKLNHILKNGVASWNNKTPYLAGSSVQHTGNVWLCKTTNANSAPTDANENWKRIITVESLTTVLAGYVALTGNQTIGGYKTFSNQIIATAEANTYSGAGLTVVGNGIANTIFPSIGFHQPGLFAGNIVLTSDGVFNFFNTDGVTKSSVVANLIGNAATVTNGVYTVGNQTISGVKTFSSSPIVPTPTTGTQAVNKDYVDSKSTLPIGTILNGYTIFDNCIVAFGGEFNRADYPKLWAYLQANPTLVKTQAEWTTESTANGGICGFFSRGDGTTTFRVPNLDKAFLRPDSRDVASYQVDAFQGHKHSANTMAAVSTDNPTTTGTNQYAGKLVDGLPISDGTNGTPRTANETRPKNIAVLPLIVAK